MNNIEFVQKLKDIVTNYKTLYVLGCFGAPMNKTNKARWINEQAYNRKPTRKAKIEAASTDTFGFDCVCLIKAVLWGWNGNKNAKYGGVKYTSNNVPDIDDTQMIDVCKDVTTNFSRIQVGEALWIPGHIGVYIGDGLAVECTPNWKDGVQITTVYNIQGKSDNNGRFWTKHGKLPYITYVEESKPQAKPQPAPVKDEYTLKEFVSDVQRVCGAAVDGISGPETLSKTVTVSAKYNRTHAVVKFIQKRLAELGYTEVGEIDGEAGPKFTSAVTHFQKDNGCTADGIISARNKTWEKLLSVDTVKSEPVKPEPKPEPTPTPVKDEYTLKEFVSDVQRACGAAVDGIAGTETLSKTVTISAKYNRKHAVVKYVQKRLAELGYSEVGEVDGVAGPNFTSAMTRFQKDNGCTADGVITARNKTWKKLLGMA